jgi:hypothetical protein
MNDAKIQLSPEEIRLVEDASWILTKNSIMAKTTEMFGQLASEMKQHISATAIPLDARATNPKISKGENYLGLPYVMLDYPRLFGRDAVFAIRIFFWWANYFSITLHLKGAHKTLWTDRIRKNRVLLGRSDFYLSISLDEWRHQLSPDNYLPIAQLSETSLTEAFEATDFLKISAKIDLHEWNQAKSLLWEKLELILQVLEI